MKNLITTTMLMPAYASRFACIGGDCEDTCCAGCHVPLDRGSFLHYKASLDPVLKPLFAQHVHRNPASKSDADYGTLDLQEDDARSCVFLNEQKLCRIFENLGEPALSDTCTYYPRTVLQFGALYQVTLGLSCPEAARLALLERDAFELVTQEQTVSQGYLGISGAKFGLSLEAMEEVRNLLYQVLLSEDTPLSDRLKAIGRFCNHLTGLVVTRQIEALPALLRDLARDLDSGALFAPFAGQEASSEVLAQVTAPYLRVGWDSHRSPHVRSVLDEVTRGLGFQGDHAPEGPSLVRAYETGLARLAPALEAVPWLLEHYLRNEFLKEFFPWVLGNPKRHYATVILRFALIRLMLAGRAAASGTTLTPHQLAETIQVGCRRYVNDLSFTLHAAETLTQSGWDAPERLGTLL